MFTRITMTAMGRWFRASRGRAGRWRGWDFPPPRCPAGARAAFAAVIGWRGIWVLVALALRPSASRRRSARSWGAGGRRAARAGREGSPSWAAGTGPGGGGVSGSGLPLILTPGLVGTVVFFRRAHIAASRAGRSRPWRAAYPVYAAASVTGDGARLALGPLRTGTAPAGIGKVDGLGTALIGPANQGFPPGSGACR